MFLKFIFKESNLSKIFDTGNRAGILLGDGGYPCKNWLLPPFRENQIRGCCKRENYNREHKRACCIIERAFDQLKRRWGCLNGELRFAPEKACKVIFSAFALHNVAKEMNMPEIDDGRQALPQPPLVCYDGDEETGVRQHIVDTYFDYELAQKEVRLYKQFVPTNRSCACNRATSD